MGHETRYTFGDSDLALERLKLLADVTDPATEELLLQFGPRAAPHAVDLGCGPGRTTRLLHGILEPALTSGLDSSARFIAKARERAAPGVRFELHDVTRAPFPVPPADVLLCRYLLTHLRSPEHALVTWAGAANPGATLFVQEVESMESDSAVLSRYYALVGKLQARCGQAMNVGGLVDSTMRRTAWRVLVSGVRTMTVDASRMARLHVMNLATWRDDPAAVAMFDPAELASLEESLAAISEGRVQAPAVRHGLREMVAVLGE